MWPLHATPTARSLPVPTGQMDKISSSTSWNLLKGLASTFTEHVCKTPSTEPSRGLLPQTIKKHQEESIPDVSTGLQEIYLGASPPCHSKSRTSSSVSTPPHDTHSRAANASSHTGLPSATHATRIDSHFRAAERPEVVSPVQGRFQITSSSAPPTLMESVSPKESLSGNF